MKLFGLQGNVHRLARLAERQVPEVEGPLDEEDEPEIKTPPEIVPERPPPPTPWDRAE